RPRVPYTTLFRSRCATRSQNRNSPRSDPGRLVLLPGRLLTRVRAPAHRRWSARNTSCRPKFPTPPPTFTLPPVTVHPGFISAYFHGSDRATGPVPRTVRPGSASCLSATPPLSTAPTAVWLPTPTATTVRPPARLSPFSTFVVCLSSTATTRQFAT